jgi:hypothetical protein
MAGLGSRANKRTTRWREHETPLNEGAHIPGSLLCRALQVPVAPKMPNNKIVRNTLPMPSFCLRVMHHQFCRIVPITTFEIGSFQPGENPLLSESRKTLGKVVLHGPEDAIVSLP